jgi:enoyl-CoA hydratase/3-hydroxyacyl-CoA dehydrogenase
MLLISSCLSPVLRSLKESFDQAVQRDDVKAIVVTGIAMWFSVELLSNLNTQLN